MRKNLKLNNKGQTLVEYVLIISLIAGAAILAVRIFGGYLQDAITKMGCQVSGKEFVEAKNEDGKRIVGEGYCEGEESVIFK